MQEALEFEGGTWGASEPGRNFHEMVDLLSHASTADDVPDGAAPPAPGDRMATELAHSTQHSLFHDEHTHRGAPERPGNEDALGSMLGLVGRNTDATAALFTGNNDVAGYDAQLPENYDRHDFVESIYTHPWEDGGAAAAGLFEAIPKAMEAGDPAGQQAWDGLMDTITTTDNGGWRPGDHGTFKTLMGPDGESAMMTNPELARSLYEVTAADLDDFTTNKASDAMVTNDDHVRMMTLLSSNPDTAGALSAAVQQHQQGIAHEYINGDGDRGDMTGDHRKVTGPADRMSLLQSKLDGGLFNAAREAGLEEHEAEKQRMAYLNTGTDILAAVLSGPTYGGSGATNAVLSQAMTVPEPDLNDVDLPSGWTDGGEDGGFNKRARAAYRGPGAR